VFALETILQLAENQTLKLVFNGFLKLTLAVKKITPHGMP